MLPDPKTGQRVGLADFQKFIIALTFGWVKKDTGYRRFTKIVISMSRKNGKSLLIAGIALYELLYETAPMASRQVYSTANTKEQASICFRMIKTQLQAVRKQSKAIRSFTKVNKYDIETKDDSFCKALASDSSVLDGLDVCCSIFDEMAENKDTSIIEVIESSQSQQMQPLNLMISTTSANLTGHYHMEEYPMTMKVLTGEVEADHYLALWWEMDSMEEADDEENWMKSNPLFEKPEVRKHMLEHKRAKLKEGTAKGNLTNFMTKELNFWVADEATAYVSKPEWMACKIDEEIDIRGKEVFIG
ncbi:terminase large subunit, partial [Bacillus thuringiensis]|nr:terminase large subunit [Bacillus thuringiensis]